MLAALRRKCLYRYDVSPSVVSEVEREFAARAGVPHALAVNSGTSALICALTGLGIGPGDEVIVPAYTWIAVPNAVVAVGAVPIIAEIDDSLTLDPSDVERKLGPATRALIAVHMRGAPCRMDELGAVAKQAGVRVVEDVAQAPGGSHRERPLGGIGDAAAFSFQGYKVVTCGEGGMVLAKDRDVFLRALAYHDFDAPHYFGVSEQAWAERASPGQSLRMHELEAALLSTQLARLDSTVARMRAHKAQLKSSLADLVAAKGCRFRALADERGEIGLALVVYLPDPAQARAVAHALRAEGVDGASVLFDPKAIDYHVYAHWTAILDKRTPSGKAGPWSWCERAVDYRSDMCPKTSDLLGRALHLDVSPELSGEQIEDISAAVRKVLTALLRAPHEP